MKKLLATGLLLILPLIMLTPISAQLGDPAVLEATGGDDATPEPVQLPDGSFVIPGQEGNQEQSEEDKAKAEQEARETKQQDFIAGATVGAAVGLVAGGVLVWFLKPSRKE